MWLPGRELWLLGAGAFIFILGGCSTGTGPEAIEVEPTNHVEVSPFDEFRNILWGMGLDEEAERRQWDADRLRQENMIAECMHELGFDYIPDIGRITLELPGDSWRPNDPEFVAQYGYGLVSRPLNAVPQRTFGSNFGHPDNPNLPMFEELSETEQRAFIRALSGNDPSVFTRTVGDWDFHDCNNWSFAVIHQERQVMQGDEWRPLQEAINQLHYRLENDVTEADRAWATCMSDAGYPWFDHQWEAERYFSDTFSEFISTWDWTQGRPNPTISPEVAALQEQEIEMALTDLNCRITTDFVTKRSAHIHEVENQFISDHKEALETLRAASEQRD